jgi:hypothetical protein
MDSVQYKNSNNNNNNDRNEAKKMLTTQSICTSLLQSQMEVPFLPLGQIQIHPFSAEFVNLNNKL